MGNAQATAEDVVRLEGVLDGRHAPAVRAALYETLASVRHGGTCTVDLSAATLVDLTVLRAVAVASRHAERAGVHVVLRGGPAAVRRCVQLSGLGRWLRWDRSDSAA
ncbi:STAS domain-containing protein [Nocardioidaceae bacterium]|nr:STAS domain-containing protein [Nocardioidaceae bacterium]